MSPFCHLLHEAQREKRLPKSRRSSACPVHKVQSHTLVPGTSTMAGLAGFLSVTTLHVQGLQIFMQLNWLSYLIAVFKYKCILHEILRQVRMFHVCTSVFYKGKYAVAVRELPIGSHPFHLTPEMGPYNLICKLLSNRDIRNTLHKAAGQMDSWKSRLSLQLKHYQ